MAKTGRSGVEFAPFAGIALLLVVIVGFLFSGSAIIRHLFPYPNPTPTPTPVASPTPTPTATSATPTPSASATPTPRPTFDELVYNEVKKLTEGRLVFNPPNTMKQGQQERIEARIASQDIGAALTQGLTGRGRPEIEKIKVASLMKVALSAEKNEFQITELSSDEQVVTGQAFAQWEWTVTPLDYGERNLHLKATARVVVEGYGEKSVDVPVITKTIKVRISPGYIIRTKYANASTLQLFLGGGGILAALGGIAGWLFRKKRRAAGFIRQRK